MAQNDALAGSGEDDIVFADDVERRFGPGSAEDFLLAQVGTLPLGAEPVQSIRHFARLRPALSLALLGLGGLLAVRRRRS